jgi:hypothetical protein
MGEIIFQTGLYFYGMNDLLDNLTGIRAAQSVEQHIELRFPRRR